MPAAPVRPARVPPMPLPPLLVLLAAAAADGERAPLTAPRPAAVTAELLGPFVADLGAGDYRTRRAASDRLERAGAAAAGLLAGAARDADPERRTRAVEALARGLQAAAKEGAEEDVLTLLAALRAVADDSAAPGDSGAAAKATLDRFPSAATAAAVAGLRARGAAVMRRSVPGVFGDLGLSVTIDDRWTGGADGLALLRDVARLDTVYLTDGALPDAARADLLAGKFGALSVERRGKAFLGIQFNPTVGNGCLIDTVTVGGPADRAGLRGGDEILSFGDRAVTSSGGLLDAIREIGTLGEPTPVKVRRGWGTDAPPGTEETVRVTLSRWPDGPQVPRRRARELPPGLRLPPRQVLPPRLVPNPVAPGERPADPEPGGVDPADGGDTPD